MSLRSRIANVFRGDRLAREIDEELQSHIDEAIENGRDPDEVRRAFGPRLATRDASRDIRLVPWLDSLRADVSFGWHQLIKSKVTSAAAILSLGLAVGAGMSAFRLVDAVLLRPLPIDHPERLHLLLREGLDESGQPRTSHTYDYPLFRALRADADPQTELIAVSFSRSTDLTFGSDVEMEKAYRQYVSGWMFAAFGLRPALGRLLTEDDDRIPQGHPYAVLSHDYWKSRFGADPGVIGKTFTLDKRLYEIVGVVQPGFRGTEPEVTTDIFVPTMMNPSVESSGSTWFQTLALIDGDFEDEALARMQVTFDSQLQDRKDELRSRGLPEAQVEARTNQRLRLDPASAGASFMQRSYREALVVLSVLVMLVLLIACANVANLMTARSSSRAREMALRVAIGAGRRRLVQLVLMESALISIVAALIAAAFAWWVTPQIVGMISLPSGPARLALPFDWRLFRFSLGLTLAVTIICGLTPALHASAVRPLEALKGGGDPNTRRPLMNFLIGAQVTFCAVVLFFAGLFVATLQRLANQPIGYSAERLLTVETVTPEPREAVTWSQVANRLRSLPGVETVSLASWPLMSGTMWATNVRVNQDPASAEMALALRVTPGWIDTMRIPLLDGRDLRADEVQPPEALVNTAFAKTYFNGENPVGKSIEQSAGANDFDRVEVVGLVGDAKYDAMREPAKPTIYVPFRGSASRGAFIVRTTVEAPLALADTLRREIPKSRSEFYVQNVTTQQELNDSKTVRERLLALLALFFAAVALILSAVGIYGVLHYSVVQRRRDIGIRIALGAQSANVALRLTKSMFAPVLLGSCVGLATGVGLERYVADLLWNVEATDPAMMAVPALAILAALLAAVPEVIRAVRIDPTELLRAD